MRGTGKKVVVFGVKSSSLFCILYTRRSPGLTPANARRVELSCFAMHANRKEQLKRSRMRTALVESNTGTFVTRPERWHLWVDYLPARLRLMAFNSSAIKKASSIAWLALRRGSQCVR